MVCPDCVSVTVWSDVQRYDTFYNVQSGHRFWSSDFTMCTSYNQCYPFIRVVDKRFVCQIGDAIYA